MALILWSEKGSGLVAPEIDGNFVFLKGLIDGLSAGVTAESISSISIDTDGIHITGTLGTSWGPFPIPVEVHARGDWVTATAYVPNDFVQNGSNLYVVAKPHTSGVFADDVTAGNLVLAFTGATGGSGGSGSTGFPAFPTSNAASGNRVVKFNEDNGSGGPTASWGWVSTDEILTSDSTSLTDLLNALDTRIAALEAH